MLSITEQCDALGLSRSSYYYQPVPTDPNTLALMRCIDELYLKNPSHGYRRIHADLLELGYKIGDKLVLSLMRQMGIQSILPKKKLSISDKEHKKYPYLLSGMKIARPNQVWSTDITFIPMLQGFLYLVAIIDWYSRCILSWELSNSLDVNFCLVALRRALKTARPDYFNMDQGSQFTSHAFLDVLKTQGINISMDGKGRAIDNVIIERFWWSLKYENVYPNCYASVPLAIDGIGKYCHFYSNERRHSSLHYLPPYEVYTSPEAAAERGYSGFIVKNKS